MHFVGCLLVFVIIMYDLNIVDSILKIGRHALYDVFEVTLLYAFFILEIFLDNTCLQLTVVVLAAQILQKGAVKSFSYQFFVGANRHLIPNQVSELHVIDNAKLVLWFETHNQSLFVKFIFQFNYLKVFCKLVEEVTTLYQYLLIFTFRCFSDQIRFLGVGIKENTCDREFLIFLKVFPDCIVDPALHVVSYFGLAHIRFTIEFR